MTNKQNIIWAMTSLLIGGSILFSSCDKNEESNDQLPNVTITSPSNGASVNHGEKVIIDVNAESNTSTIQEVRIYLNGQGAASDNSFPYQFEWNTSEVEKGDYTIMAKADDSNGLSGSDEVNITLVGLYTPGTFTDNRDGKTYQSVTLGTQTWMAENLNYETDTGSWVYDDSPPNAAVYGRLYNWYTAKVVCPDGWHLPSDEEWATLIDFLGGENVAGAKLKESGTDHWAESSESGTNASGFTARPGGVRYLSGDYELDEFEFDGETFFGFFWSSSSHDESFAWKRSLYFHYSSVDRENYFKGNGCSVRCVKDN